MGDCRYCHKPAGWFRSEHNTCAQEEAARRERESAARAAAAMEARQEQERKKAAVVDLVNGLFLDVAQGRASVDVVETVIGAASETNVLSADELHRAQASAWEAAALECMKDRDVSLAEDHGLALLQTRFGLTQEELNVHGVLGEVVKCKIFTALAKGLPPNVLTLGENHPVMLKGGEHPVWEFNPTTLLEDQLSGRRLADLGLLLVTTRNLYFVGQVKSFQLPFAKIGALAPFSDGVGVGRLDVTQKPLIFQTGDGTFAHRMLSTLVRLANK